MQGTRVCTPGWHRCQPHRLRKLAGCFSRPSLTLGHSILGIIPHQAILILLILLLSLLSFHSLSKAVPLALLLLLAPRIGSCHAASEILLQVLDLLRQAVQCGSTEWHGAPRVSSWLGSP